MVTLNGDIVPGEMAYTVGDGVLLDTCPTDGTGRRLIRSPSTPEPEICGHYMGNQPVLVLAVIPYEESTGQEFVAVFVMCNEVIGWMWAHELYARQPCP